jgi:ParB-like nuclease family protein
MLSDAELHELAKDIKVNGIREPVTVVPGDPTVLLDGRNRLEAAERVGFDYRRFGVTAFCGTEDEQVGFIISKNIHRRHLTKKQKVRLIDAALKAGAAEKPDRPCAVSEATSEKPDRPCEVSDSLNVETLTRELEEIDARNKGGRGKINEHKAKVTELAQAQGISASTVGDVLAEDHKPKPKPKLKPKSEANGTVTLKQGIDAAREHYVSELVKLPEFKRTKEAERLTSLFVEMLDGEE